MSWDQPVYSFGHPNAQPPTPTQTPTSAVFQSPTFETPRNTSSFEDRSGWTPQFAEEYTVFGSTPGRLISTHLPLVDIATPRPSTSSSQPQHFSEIDNELSTHVHHLSPSPNLPLPPVDPANRLGPSPDLPSSTRRRLNESSTKKLTPVKHKKHLGEAFTGQTATPPHSASKGTRRRASKEIPNTMQHESHDDRFGGSGIHDQTPHLMSFTTSTSSDLFSYPLTAPAAPMYGNNRSFWDPDTSMGDMGMDFGADGAGVLNVGSHRATHSFDWEGSGPIYQDQSHIQLPQQQEHFKQQRLLAPKADMPNTSLPASVAPFQYDTTAVSSAPFVGLDFNTAVDPVLLFSQGSTTSRTMASEFEDVTLPSARQSMGSRAQEPYQHQLRESRRDMEELRRSRSTRERVSGYRIDRAAASSPVKGLAHPSLQRSISDGRGRSAKGRTPSLGGRISPVKSQRLASLASIPESQILRPRTEVKFVIDSKGKARAHTVTVDDEPRTSRAGPMPEVREDWGSPSPPPYESSSDEETIIIPSRNSSFSLPKPKKGPRLSRFETTNVITDHRRHSLSASSYTQSESSGQRSSGRDDYVSEAETVVDEQTTPSGDAKRELRKVVENRKKGQVAAANTYHHIYSSNPNTRGGYRYTSSRNISPSTISDLDRGTPSSSRSGTTRCVCKGPDNGSFMIQCESCENWLHADCVGVDRHALPSVYICAFCAETPNLRGGRRNKERPSRRLAASPLAHKSFNSLR